VVSLKIIFVNRYFHPDHSATSQMLSDLAFELVGRELDVHVVCSRHLYDDPRSALPSVECADGVTIHRVASSRFGRDRLAGRALDYLTFYMFATWHLWRLARTGDIIVAKTDPPLVSVVAAAIARMRGARLGNWVQDLFPEVAQASGMLGARSGLFVRLLRHVRNGSLRAAETNVVVWELMAEELRKQGIRREQIQMIPNWQDGTLVRLVAHDSNPLRGAWGKPDHAH
jgi:hypothetical protein